MPRLIRLFIVWSSSSFWFLFLLTSCKVGAEKESFLPNKSPFIFSDTLIFERDETSHNFTSFFPLNERFEASYILGNREGNALIYYDDDGKIIYKQVYPFDGINGIREINGVYALNPDSIFIFTRSHVYISNYGGELTGKFLIIDSETKALSVISSLTPSYLISDNLYFNTISVEGYQNIGISYQLNLRSSKLKLSGYYPEELKDGFWIGYPFLTNYSALNPNRNTILYGIPFDPFIRETNYMGLDLKHEVVPKNYIFEGPLFKNREDLRANAANAKKLTFSKIIFGPIAFDPDKQLIYRIYFLPAEPDVIENIQIQRFIYHLQFKILAYDVTSKKVIAESQILNGKDFTFTNLFVKEGKLYLMLAENFEDEASFLGFRINSMAE